MPLSPLTKIRLLHTVIWAFFAGCIVSIPLAAAQRHFVAAAILSGMVWLECAVLAFNHLRCPLTDIAARHTTNRADNFDIYLPLWLARYNKAIFGALFALSELYLLLCWLATSSS